MLHAKLQIIVLLVPKILNVLATYGHGGHFGYVTWTTYLNFCSFFPLRLCIKFGFDWPSGSGEDL